MNFREPFDQAREERRGDEKFPLTNILTNEEERRKTKFNFEIADMTDEKLGGGG